MPEQMFWRFQPLPLALHEGFAEVDRVPVDDNCREQVQSGHVEVLALGGPIPDFALATDPQGILQRMVCFAFVQSDS